VSNSQAPLLSVVIPTCKRPVHLARAITSALNAAPDQLVEIIVVPNGPDLTWKPVAAAFSADRRVAWHPITRGNANAARNRGLALARGTYIRFLDDDDALQGEGAERQCRLIEATGADACSAPIEAVDDQERAFETLYQPDTPDFIAGAMSAKRMHQVTAHLFRTSAVRAVQWDDALSYSQDNDWIFRLCANAELSWVKSQSICGQWTRHTSERISTTAPIHLRKMVVAERLIALTKALDHRRALTDSRREAAALGLWDCVHQALFSAPRYWSGIAQIADQLHPGSKPELPMHNAGLSLLGLSPIAIEWLVAPKRLAGYGFKRALLSVGALRKW